ncbi:transcription factor 21 [Conger conger]|uniref:transcription factor 21 n=1 Tax=Conger conger TaxID=82655 RepID=UPI002A59E406|nr:transcription factor 21 [Conger conger]
MSTGSVSDVEDIQDLAVHREDLGYGNRKRNAMADMLCNSAENSEDESANDVVYNNLKKRRARTGPNNNLLHKAHKDGKQSQRNAANARERARMRVLSKAFSRLKTSLPWVPADTKLSKLDTLRLASSYISHLRQLLQEDRYESCFVHPVNLAWPFVVSGRPEETKEISAASRLCGATA